MTLQSAAQIWRDYDTDGVPVTGFHKPVKRDVKLWGEMLETMLQANRLGFATLALLNADLAHEANELAIVYADATAANNGTYQKSGSSGAGSWTRVGDLPGNLVILTVTGGTGNAITATAIETPQQPGAKLYLIVPTANNTAATTIAVNGGSAVSIKNALGSALASGSLIAGNQALMAWDTDHYQLMIAAAIDGNAILADAVAARDAAIAAASAAEIATAADRTALKALDTTLFKSCNLRESGRQGTFSWTTGNFSALITADAQEGIYVKANAIASSSGSWVRVRDDDRINASWFGTAGYTAAAAALSLAGTIGKGTVVFPDALYDIGSSTLTVPASINVLCSPTTIIRRSTDLTGATPYSLYTNSMIVLGSYCQWSGGVLDSTAVLSTSTSSNTIGTGGTKTFTVGASLGITASSFIRIESRANRANHFEGTVSSYAGTTLIINADFANGSGTFTDWDVFNVGIYHCPLVMRGVTEATVQNVRVTGRWYVGILMDGWNLTPSTALQVTKCVVSKCFAEAVMNRGFYVYGNTADCVFDTCFVEGNSGATDYGFNYNPANATGTVNFQFRTKTLGCTVNGAGFQGFATSDQCFYNITEGCTVNTITNAAGIGFLTQLANGQSPQYNQVKNCVAVSCAGAGFEWVGALYGGASGCSAVTCGTGYYIAVAGGPVQSQYVDINSSEALSSTTIGFRVGGNSVRCGLNDVKAVNNTTNGVQIDAGAVRTLVTGRAFNNTTNNILDGGTSSVTTGLTVA